MRDRHAASGEMDACTHIVSVCFLPFEAVLRHTHLGQDLQHHLVCHPPKVVADKSCLSPSAATDSQLTHPRPVNLSEKLIIPSVPPSCLVSPSRAAQERFPTVAAAPPRPHELSV